VDSQREKEKDTSIALFFIGEKATGRGTEDGVKGKIRKLLQWRHQRGACGFICTQSIHQCTHPLLDFA
jgi:hypothetical protein